MVKILCMITTTESQLTRTGRRGRMVPVQPTALSEDGNNYSEVTKLHLKGDQQQGVHLKNVIN